MNIALTTLYTPEIQDYGELTVKNKLKYAHKHHYGCMVFSKILDSTRSPSWNKIKILHDYIDVGYNWLFWTDADSIITNMEIPLEKWILEYESHGYKIIWCQDMDTEYPNAGQMLIKCCKSNEDWLDLIWKQERFINHPNWEQGAIKFLLDAKYPLKHKLLEAREFNSFAPEVKLIQDAWKWQIGDFVCHYPGLGDQRYLLIKKYLEELV